MEEISSQMRKLYVCDIASTVSAKALEEKFSSYGKLSSDIRLDRNTRNPRFAFMTYENHSDAEKAFKELNYAEFGGMQIRIMWSKADMNTPPVGESTDSNVLVKGLKEDVTSKSLHYAINKFGKVFSCKVPLALDGKSKGYGYVNFTSQKEAQKALEQNGKEFADSEGNPLTKDGKLDISRFTSHEERIKKSKDNKVGSFTNVFIKNFGDNLNDTTLNSLFSEFGLISSACVMRNSNGTSKGFGFVDFVCHDDAVDAIEKLNGTCLPGTETPLYVGRAQKKSERQEELNNKFSVKVLPKPEIKTSLYIKHLHEDVDEELLRKTFAHFGKLTKVKVDIDENTGKCNGVGYVSYLKPNDASLALRSMRTRSIMKKKIFIDYLQSRADRDVLLSAKKVPSSTTPSYPSFNKQNRSFSNSRSEHNMPPEMLYRRAIYQQPPQYFPPLSAYQQPISHTVNRNSDYMSTPTTASHHHQHQQPMSHVLSNGVLMQGIPPTSHYLLR